MESHFYSRGVVHTLEISLTRLKDERVKAKGEISLITIFFMTRETKIKSYNPARYVTFIFDSKFCLSSMKSKLIVDHRKFLALCWTNFITTH